MSTSRTPCMESLEGRQLLSAGAALHVPQVTASVVPTIAAKAAHRVGAYPNLLGTWTGDVKVKVVFFSEKLSTTLVITGQTAATITGTLTVSGKSQSGTFLVTWHRDNKFEIALQSGKSKIKLNGQLNTAGTEMTGDGSVSYNGFSAHGSFDLKKVS